MFFDELWIKTIMSRGNWGVRREDGLPGDPRRRLIERDAFIDHSTQNRLENAKSTVALVQVQNAGSNAHSPQSAIPPDAQQQLLTNSDATVASIQARTEISIFGSISIDIRIEQVQIPASHTKTPDLCANHAATCFDLHHHGLAVCSDGAFHRQLIDVGLEIFLLLPTVAVQPLPEIALAIKQSHANQGDIQIRRALEVVACQNSQAARVDRNRLVQSELGGEVPNWPGPQDAGVPRAPGVVVFEILAQAAIGVVDETVQHLFFGAALDFFQGNLREQRDWIVVQLAPADRVQVKEQACRVGVPAPPEIPGQRPQTFLDRNDETVERASFTYHGRNLRCSLNEHTNLFFAEQPRLDGLNDEDSLKHAAIDQRNTEERVVLLFARLWEVLEARMTLGILNCNGANLFGDQTSKAFTQRHSQGAYAFRTQPQCCRQKQIAAVWLEQIRGTDIRVESFGNQLNDVAQRLGWLAAFLRQVGDLLQRKDVFGFGSLCHGTGSRDRTSFSWYQPGARKAHCTHLIYLTIEALLHDRIRKNLPRSKPCAPAYEADAGVETTEL